SLVNQINLILGNYGKTIDLENYISMKTGDLGYTEFISELNNVSGVIFYNTNPAYNTPDAAKLKAALGKMELSVSTGYYKDETASLCQYVAPDNHFLESWDLVECEKGKYSFVQPTIAPVFETRQGQVSLALWSDNAAFGKGEE